MKCCPLLFVVFSSFLAGQTLAAAPIPTGWIELYSGQNFTGTKLTLFVDDSLVLHVRDLDGLAFDNTVRSLKVGPTIERLSLFVDDDEGDSAKIITGNNKVQEFGELEAQFDQDIESLAVKVHDTYSLILAALPNPKKPSGWVELFKTRYFQGSHVYNTKVTLFVDDQKEFKVRDLNAFGKNEGFNDAVQSFRTSPSIKTMDVYIDPDYDDSSKTYHGDVSVSLDPVVTSLIIKVK